MSKMISLTPDLSEPKVYTINEIYRMFIQTFKGFTVTKEKVEAFIKDVTSIDSTKTFMYIYRTDMKDIFFYEECLNVPFLLAYREGPVTYLPNLNTSIINMQYLVDGIAYNKESELVIVVDNTSYELGNYYCEWFNGVQHNLKLFTVSMPLVDVINLSLNRFPLGSINITCADTLAQLINRYGYCFTAATIEVMDTTDVKSPNHHSLVKIKKSKEELVICDGNYMLFLNSFTLADVRGHIPLLHAFKLALANR